MLQRRDDRIEALVDVDLGAGEQSNSLASSWQMISGLDVRREALDKDIRSSEQRMPDLDLIAADRPLRAAVGLLHDTQPLLLRPR